MESSNLLECVRKLGKLNVVDTDIHPIERLLRDVRLITIWTGTNEIMHLVIQHEFYKEFLAERPKGHDVEADTEGAELPDEKIYNVEGEVT